MSVAQNNDCVLGTHESLVSLCKVRDNSVSESVINYEGAHIPNISVSDAGLESKNFSPWEHERRLLMQRNSISEDIFMKMGGALLTYICAQTRIGYQALLMNMHFNQLSLLR